MEGNIITMQDIFLYKQHGYDENGKAIGKFVTTGLKPHFLEKFEMNGVDIAEDFFAVESGDRGMFF